MKPFEALVLSGALLFLPATGLQARVTWQELINHTTSPEGLLGTPEEFADVVPPQAVPAPGLRFFTDMMGTLYDTFNEPPPAHYFFCTVYYTPLETGFTAKRGFDLTPKVMKGSM